MIFVCDQEENSLVLMGSFRHPSSRFFYIFSLISWALEEPVIPPVDLRKEGERDDKSFVAAIGDKLIRVSEVDGKWSVSA